MKPFYITATLPYANGEPHIGFAMEIIRADIIARYKKTQGFDVFFNTGTDDHGQKIFQSAQDKGLDTKTYVDGIAQRFKDLHATLGLLPEIHFIRTTDPRHIAAAQEFWKRCDAAGYIYKKNYSVKYCVGCELSKTESELENGRCPIHPNREIEIILEENYFFKWSAFQKPLLDFYAKNPTFVIPEHRYKEIRAFVERGLEDFSISRLKSKMQWGVPVPGDDTQVMYVWFDALTSYISTLGWPQNEANFKKWWTNPNNPEEGIAVQYCGKDNLRQQSAMWQAMLMSVNLPNSRQIVINGFVTDEGGLKMSKSVGDTVNPFDIVAEFGADALRYFVTRELSPFEDSPFTLEKFKEAYNANLANGLGNLVSRIMKMATTHGVILSDEDKKTVYYGANHDDDFTRDFDLSKRMDAIWKNIASINESIQRTEPFKKIKVNPEEAKKDIYVMLYHLFGVALALEPFLPETSLKIQALIKEGKMPEQPLFARKD